MYNEDDISCVCNCSSGYLCTAKKKNKQKWVRILILNQDKEGICNKLFQEVQTRNFLKHVVRRPQQLKV